MNPYGMPQQSQQPDQNWRKWEGLLYHVDFLLKNGPQELANRGSLPQTDIIELPIRVCKLDVSKETIPESVIQQPIESFINGEDNLPQLVFVRQVDGGFDKKESLLGYFGTSEPPQKALAIVDFVMHTTKMVPEAKKLLQDVLEQDLVIAHENEVSMMKKKWEYINGQGQTRTFNDL